MSDNRILIVTPTEESNAEVVNYKAIQETSDEPQEESGDAVQSLINAVQELIQKHDNLTDDKNKPNT